MRVSLFLVIFSATMLSKPVSSMTRQQLKNSGKLLKKACMPKNDVTEDQIGDIDKGKFIEDRNVMCYVACIYSMSQAVSVDVPKIYSSKQRIGLEQLPEIYGKGNRNVKNNKIAHDAMTKQVDMMFPPDMKEPVKAAIDSCKGVAKKYKDICEASFWTAKCIYEYDPANFVFA